MNIHLFYTLIHFKKLINFSVIFFISHKEIFLLYEKPQMSIHFEIFSLNLWPLRVNSSCLYKFIYTYIYCILSFFLDTLINLIICHSITNYDTDDWRTPTIDKDYKKLSFERRIEQRLTCIITGHRSAY